MGRGRTLRITGGVYSGLRVSCPPGVIRPAMDRMRESLFAILGDLTGASFLDLFCGSAIVGIEAASRGAEPVAVVEKDYRKRQTILKNIEVVKSSIDLHLMPVARFIAANEQPFDTIFLDPPFRFPHKLQVIRSIEEQDTLATSGRLIIHLPREEEIPERIGSLRLVDHRRYGGSRLMFYTSTTKVDVPRAKR